SQLESGFNILYITLFSIPENEIIYIHFILQMTIKTKHMIKKRRRWWFRSPMVLWNTLQQMEPTGHKLASLYYHAFALLSHSQVLFVPDANFPSSTLRLSSSSPGATVSPSSSDAEYDKLPVLLVFDFGNFCFLKDADLARKALKPIERVLSSTSEEDEPGVVKFLKMNCRYFTDGKGVVGGVMIVTPNNIMFDPHKSDPLVIENGCEEYGLICPMEEVVSIALYNDISHMKIKDALPSPGEWEDLASEKDINPFSKFKSLSKEKRQQNGERIITSDSKSTRPLEKSTEYTQTKPSDSSVSRKLKKLESSTEAASGSTPVANIRKEPSDTQTAFESIAKENSLLGEDDDFVDLEELSSQTDSGMDKRDTSKECLSLGPEELRKTKSQIISSTVEKQAQSALNFSGPECDAELKGALDLETCEKQDIMPEVDKQSGSPDSQVENTLSIHEDLDKVKLIEYYLNKNKEGTQLSDNLQKAELTDGKSIEPVGIDITLSSSLPQAGDPPTEGNKEPEKTWVKERPPLPLQLGSSTEENMNKEDFFSFMCNSDILPSKEEKSKTPPMFLCIKVGKPMRKSFATHMTAMVQQYGKRRKQPEYWFAVPRER
ncbi:Nuclear receptor coactivator 7, partial [Camelus dromedarius]